MSLRILISTVSLLLISTAACAEKTPVSALDVIHAMQDNFGKHVGVRSNHAKGMCAAGYFVGDKQKNYSISPLFSGEKIPVIARFSLPGGNPSAPDFARSPRGLALQFALPKGQHNMAMLNTPMFGAAKVETFYQGLLASKPDSKTGKPDPEKIKAFRAAYPDSQAQADYLAQHNPPSSWEKASYYGIHAFYFIDQQQQSSMVRWQFVPHDGEQELSDKALAKADANFLNKNFSQRLKQGDIHWDMWITLGQEGDTSTDPSQLWPDDRQKVKVGTLTLNSDEAACDGINFDPMVLSQGVQASDDEILRFRSLAYAISFAKRLSRQP